VDCPVQDTILFPPFIPNIPEISNDIPAKRFRAADCPNLPSGFFQEYESQINLQDGGCILPSITSCDSLPLHPPVPHNFVQSNLASSEHAVNLASTAGFETYMTKKESIFKTRTDFLFENLKKQNDSLLKRTANLDACERRLIEDRSAFEEHMLRQQQAFASDQMASNYLTHQLNDSLTMVYGNFSSK